MCRFQTLEKNTCFRMKKMVSKNGNIFSQLLILNHCPGWFLGNKNNRQNINKTTIIFCRSSAILNSLKKNITLHLFLSLLHQTGNLQTETAFVDTFVLLLPNEKKLFETNLKSKDVSFIFWVLLPAKFGFITDSFFCVFHFFCS